MVGGEQLTNEQECNYEQLTKEYRERMLEMQFNGMTSAALDYYYKTIGNAYGNK